MRVPAIGAAADSTVESVRSRSRRLALGLAAGAVHVVHGTRVKLWLGVTVCREVRWMHRTSL